ncbi:lytic transglycosylase domain-containing protein [Thermopolyspora sp. NPDC052614]|uniref:lytic transglycosylase domain-containing protein n=1 Tax=Thermopolyspora sp. NPDC052614 TaxID=3155682 RepID=UPI00342B974B
MSRLPQLALVVGTLAGVILVTIAAAGTFLLVRGGPDGTDGADGADTAFGGFDATAPTGGTGDRGTADAPQGAARADLPSAISLLAMPGDRAAAGSGPDQAGPAASPGGQATGTAPTVIKLSPPTLVAVAPRPLTDDHLRRIRTLRHVNKTATLGGGAVRVSGVTLNLLAVPVEEFRAWTPVGVADRPEPWDALRRGEFIAEAATARRLSLVPGAYYQLDGGPRLRLAASAAIGLPGVDGYVSEETGRRLGLMPGAVVLVNGPAAQATTVSRQVRRVLGDGSQVALTGPAAAARPAPSASATPLASAAPPSRETFTGRVGRPGSYIELYQRAATLCPGLSWTVLAAIGQVESGHGRNNGPSSAGALGPMQFMPATWKVYGVDGDGDGKADIWSPYDAVPGAANYLCAVGAGQGGRKLEKAVWHYNHSWSYVAKVLNLANAYAAAYP